MANGDLFVAEDGGAETIVFQLPHFAGITVGLPVFATIKMSNADTGVGTVECLAQTLDTTPPEVTIADAFALAEALPASAGVASAQASLPTTQREAALPPGHQRRSIL